jgi:hypothetical protein
MYVMWTGPILLAKSYYLQLWVLHPAEAAPVAGEREAGAGRPWGPFGPDGVADGTATVLLVLMLACHIN